MARKKKALIIRHVPYEGVAGYRAPIEAAGYEVDRIDVSDPGFSEIDLREPFRPMGYDGGLNIVSRLENGPVEVVNLIADRNLARIAIAVTARTWRASPMPAVRSA